MVPFLLLCAIFFQATPQEPPKPAIDNDRVTVWGIGSAPAARAYDTVEVSVAGTAQFWPSGKMWNHPPRFSIMIDLKDHPVAPIANTTGYPLAFPRPGSKMILENDRVIVWDCTWTPGVATPMHFHDKDVVVVFLDDGDLSSTTPDGQVTVNSFARGAIRFNPRDRTHTETLVRGKQRAIITELK